MRARTDRLAGRADVRATGATAPIRPRLVDHGSNMTLKTHLRSLLGALVLAVAAPCFASCDNEDDARKTFDSLEADLQAVLSSRKDTQAAITREYQDKATASGWTKERGSRLFADLLASSTFKDFEKQKQPPFQEVMDVIHMGLQANGQEDLLMTCRAAGKLGPALERVRSIDAQEHAYMLQQVRDAR